MNVAATSRNGTGEPFIAANERLQRLVAQLRLLYQPVIRLEDMKATKVEVLARTLEPDGRLSGPETLLAAMDGVGASMALTEEVMRRGMTEQAANDLGDGLCFVFNLPLDAMLHADMIRRIETTRAEIMPRGLIDFELTERHPVRDVGELSLMLGRLRRLNYHVALDDVMPTTPKLAELVALPFGTIKLDCSVVTTANAGNDAFIRSVVEGATQRGQSVVAEGIETETTLRRMRALGVSHGQGFLFARPMPAAALRDFLFNWAQREAP